MARKKRKIKVLRTRKRAKPLKTSSVYTPIRFKRKRVKRVELPTLSPREPIKRVLQNEAKKPVRKKAIQSVLSGIQNDSCRRKKAKARHDYFSMRATGAGSYKKPGPHKNRFTVRCSHGN